MSRLGIYRASLLKSQLVLGVRVVGLGFTVTVRDIRTRVTIIGVRAMGMG